MKQKLAVLFEDPYIIIVSKPSGMLSVSYPGFRGKTAQDILTDMHKSRGKMRIAVVHRLDRDTSGVMMFACTGEAKERIMGDWHTMVTERTYHCVCLRNPGAEPLKDSGTINAPLAYNKADVAYVPKNGDGKGLRDSQKAITHYKVLTRGRNYDLVACELETGRKNQIRAHLAHLGHPVAGDSVYGGEDAGDGPDGRLGLHARVLAFKHPFTGEMHRFEVSESGSFAKMVGSGKAAGEKRSGVGAARGADAGSAQRADISRRGIETQRRGKNASGGAGAGQKKTFEKRNSNKDDDFSDLRPLPGKPRPKRGATGSRFIPSKPWKG